MKKRTWILFLLYFIFTSCSAIMFKYDMNNPCNLQRDAQDSIECENWKAKYPKSYEKYLKRMQEHEEKGRIKEFYEKYEKVGGESDSVKVD